MGLAAKLAHRLFSRILEDEIRAGLSAEEGKES
jgi:hypothetical protein